MINNKRQTKPHMTRKAKYDEALLEAKHIYEEILAVNRMMMTETIPFYRF